jgi:protein-ribulosamine 3-kinase
MKIPPYRKYNSSQNTTPPIRLLGDAFRIPVEHFVSDYTGRAWTVTKFRDMNDFSSHQSAILSNGTFSVFAKLSEAANGLEQFEVEMNGLQLLSNLFGALIPKLIGIVPAENGNILLLESVHAIDRTPKEWRDIGRMLARIHQIKETQYGLDANGYFGPLYQDNRPMSDWPTFFAERRLWPRLMGAINAGRMTTSAIRDIEKLISRLPNLCGPETTPTLLHGDAQQNNFISTEAGAVVIDPAVYYGNPEMDIAYVDYFEPVPDDVFIGYQEILPIDPGFDERRDLWRIYGYLAIVEVEGESYLDKLMNAMWKYL